VLRKKAKEKKKMLKIKRDRGGVTDGKKLISRLRYGRWRGVRKADRREASETQS